MKLKKLLVTGCLIGSMAGAVMPLTAYANYDPVEAGEVVDVTEETEAETVEVSEPEIVEEPVVVVDYGDPILSFTDETEAEPQDPLTPDGNLTLVDDIGSSTGAGKQFITMVTKNGNYFYLIIDRDDEGEETVHFLNQVDEADLLALMEDEDVEKYEDELLAKKEKEEAEAAAKETTETDTETVTPVQEKKQVNMLPFAVLGLAGLAGGGIFVWKKVKDAKKPAEKTGDPDADYNEDDDGDEIELAEDEEEAADTEEETEGEDENE